VYRIADVTRVLVCIGGCPPVKAGEIRLVEVKKLVMYRGEAQPRLEASLASALVADR
jgi:hypothetical protein